MKKFSYLLILTLAMGLVGCGNQKNDLKPEDSLEQFVETTEETVEQPNLEVDGKIISPLPSIINLDDDVYLSILALPCACFGILLPR